MDKDRKNIGDDMSNFLHAAEEWANERLLDINSSDNLDDSISYPVYVPVEEVARQVVLELCKIYNWNPETGADSRLLKQNERDTAFIQQSSVLHNIYQDISASSSTEMNIEYNQEDTLPNTVQPLNASKCNDVINKTFIVRRNTSLSKLKQLDTAPQVIMNKTFAVRKNTWRNTLKQVDTSDQINDMNETYILRNNPFKVTKDLDTLSKVSHDNAKQKSIVPKKLAILPVSNTNISLAEDASCGSESFAIHNVEKKVPISPNDIYSDTVNNDKISNSNEYLENMKQKFHSNAFTEKLAVNPTLDANLSYKIIHQHQFPISDLVPTIPRMVSTIEAQKTSGMFVMANSGSNNTSRNNLTVAHENGSTVDSLCKTENSDIITVKHTANTLFPSDETTAGTSMLTANEVIQSSFSKASMNNADMPGNTMYLPENPRTAIITTVKKEESSPITGPMKVNASQNDTSHRTLSEENRALIIKLEEKLKLLQSNDNSSQSIIQKSANNSVNSPLTVKHSGKCFPAAARNSDAIEEFETTVISPRTGNIMQTKFSIYPPDSKNCANLERDTDGKSMSQKQLIIGRENAGGAINVIRECFVANNQTQITRSYLENYCDKSKEFQTMIKNDVFSRENDLHFKDMTGKEFITKAIQTDQENENKPDNNLCNKLNSFSNQKLPTSNGMEEKNRFRNESFDTSQLIMDLINDRIASEMNLRTFLDEEMKFFNYMSSSSSSVRRRSFPFLSRSMPNFNRSSKFIPQSATRPKTIREVLRSTPTMMTPILKPKMKQNWKGAHSIGANSIQTRNPLGKSHELLEKKEAHLIRAKNPPKKPNELPLENRASRLKAEYLAKKRAEKEFANQSKMLENKKLTPVMVGRLSMLRKKLPPVSKDTVKSNIPLSLNTNNRCNICKRNTISTVNEISQITDQRNERMKAFEI